MTRVAVVQAGSVPFDTPATVTKTLAHIASAAAEGAELVVFPGAFLGTYPSVSGARSTAPSRSSTPTTGSSGTTVS